MIDVRVKHDYPEPEEIKELQRRLLRAESALQHVLNESDGGSKFSWRHGKLYRLPYQAPDISNRLGMTVTIPEQEVDLSDWL